MRFKPVKLTLVFWALAGASLTVSGAALADSSSAPAVSNSAHESEIISIDGVSKASQTNTQGTTQNSVDGTSQSANDNSQSTTNANAKVSLVTNDNLGSVNGQSAGSTPNEGGEKNDSGIQATQIATVGVDGKLADLTQTTITKSDQPTLSSATDKSKPVSVSVAEISAKISQSDAASKTIVRNNKSVVPAALVQDSGGLTAPVAEAPSTPTHHNPTTPIGVMGEFNALMHAVVPVSQIGVVSLWPGATGSKALDFGLTSWIMLGVVVCAGLFVTNLRRSGFTNGARSDIPNFSFLVANSQRMGLVRATVNGSFFSEVNS